MVTRREVALAGAMDRRDELLKNQFPVGDKRHGARHQGFGRDGPPRHVGGESRWPHTVGGGSHPPCKWLTSARVRYNCWMTAIVAPGARYQLEPRRRREVRTAVPPALNRAMRCETASLERRPTTHEKRTDRRSASI